MVYMGTAVAYGRGEAIVVATGMRTELGRIAAAMEPWSARRRHCSAASNTLPAGLPVIALLLVALIFVLGLLRGEDPRLTFMTAISLAVAAVPEGLPAVVTVTLALGAQRMLRRRALVRKLLAVETLGSVSVICSDKTGTLTHNRMTVTQVVVGGQRLDLTDAHASLTPGLELLLAAGALCNDAFVQPASAGNSHTEAVGDPTEVALAVAASQFGCWKSALDADYPRVGEVPFDSVQKRMLTVHRAPVEVRQGSVHLPSNNSTYIACAKGAPDTLLEACTALWTP